MQRFNPNSSKRSITFDDPTQSTMQSQLNPVPIQKRPIYIKLNTIPLTSNNNANKVVLTPVQASKDSNGNGVFVPLIQRTTVQVTPAKNSANDSTHHRLPMKSPYKNGNFITSNGKIVLRTPLKLNNHCSPIFQSPAQPGLLGVQPKDRIKFLNVTPIAGGLKFTITTGVSSELHASARQPTFKLNSQTPFATVVDSSQSPANPTRFENPTTHLEGVPKAAHSKFIFRKPIGRNVLQTKDQIQFLTAEGFGSPITTGVSSNLSASARQPTFNLTTQNQLATEVKRPRNKFNFPTPPQKPKFKIATKTRFATTVDTQEPSTSLSSEQTPGQEAFQLNGDYPTFKRLKMCTPNHMLDKTYTNVVEPELWSRETIPYTNPSNSDHVDESNLLDEENDATVDQPNEDDSNTENVTITSGDFKELLNRVRHLETLELANSKQGAEAIVVLKKLVKKVSHFSSSADDDNDEVRSLLPIRNLPALDSFDHKYTSDRSFKSKVLSFVRGLKGPQRPENFTSVLKELMTDNLLYSFNLKGTMGKHALENYQVYKIIKEIYKPMETDTFDSIMRETIHNAKNRVNNRNYQLRRNNN